MPPEHGTSLARKALISAALSLLLAGIGLIAADYLTARILVRQLLWPLVRLLAVIALGLGVGILIEASGWTRHLGVLARPLFRFAHLGDRCGAAFTSAFFSGTAANAMLAGFHREGKISTPQLFLTNLLSQFPAYFLHLPTTLFVVIPLTGRAGLLYFGLTFAALLLRFSAFLFWGHWLFSGPSEAPSDPGAKNAAGRISGAGLAEALRTRLPGRLAGIAVHVIPIYVAVFLAQSLGLFGFIREGLAGLVVNHFVPLESLSLVVLGFTAEFTSGFATAGALLDSGALTVRQAVLALLAGNVIAFPVRALRHQLPRYLGIFQPRQGLALLLLGQGIRILSLLAVGAVYCLI
jgi:hypothetical protein